MNLKLTPVANEPPPRPIFVSPRLPISPAKLRSTRHAHLHTTLDFIGMCASLLCAVHCFVAPIVLVINPIFSWIRISRKMDIVFLAVAVVVGLCGCLVSLRQHKDYTPLCLMIAGLSVNSIGRYASMSLGPFWALTLILAGPLLMSYGLWMNHQLCRCKAERRITS